MEVYGVRIQVSNQYDETQAERIIHNSTLPQKSHKHETSKKRRFKCCRLLYDNDDVMVYLKPYIWRIG